MTEAARQNAAELDAVSHRYGRVGALADVSLAIPAGVMAGLVGPDGVGKSTLLGLVAGVRRSQDGGLLVLGGDLRNAAHRTACRQRIAYMPQGLGRNLYPTLSVAENLDHFGRLFGQDAVARHVRGAELLAATGLAPFTGRPAGKLSGGMKQKLALCCALVHEPDLLVLDEPTTGVDPLSRRQFWALINRLHARRPRMSVLVATAYMEEAERFDWLAALDTGRVIASGAPAALKAQAGSATLEDAFIRLLPEARRQGHRPPGTARARPVNSVAAPPAIEAHGLVKRFGAFTAVAGVDLTIARGEIFGFLGSNGCGKTTTMKMLTGLLPADGGEARILGRPPGAGGAEARRQVGYMSQSFSLYVELSVRQNLELHARLYGLGESRVASRVAEVLRAFDLAAVADAMPEALSLGIRQRLQLAAALVHEPELLILDEPTSGVDPIARDLFWSHLLRLSREDGVTVFLSTHFMNEAERCDRISLMHAGRVLAVGTPRELVAQRGVANLEDAFVAWLEEAADPEPPPPPPESVQPAVAAMQRRRVDPRRLFACAFREALELVRDPVRIAFALIGPVLLMLAFGFGISFDVERLPFAALDLDRTPESREIIASIAGSHYFRENPPAQDAGELEARLQSGNLVLALEIPPGFGRDLRRGARPELGILIDGAMPFRAETVRSYVAGLTQTWLADQVARERIAAPPAMVQVELRLRYNQAFRSALANVPGVIMLMLVLVPAMMTAVAVVREKETGAIANFRATPVTAPEFLVGKQLPYVAVALASFALMLVVAWLVFDVPVRGSAAALALGGLLYVLAATGFGLFVSAFVRSQVAAVFATAILAILPTVNFSGLFVPTSSLTGGGWVMGLLFPASWFHPIAVGAMTKQLGFAELWPNHVALAAFAVTYLAAACLALRKQEA